MAYDTNDRGMEIRRGDIFFVFPGGEYYGSEQRNARPGVVVSNDLANKHSPNVEMVFLTSREKKPLPTHVGVLAKVPSTALCENIRTVSKERLGDFLKSCTPVEMKKIDKALLISLGITAGNRRAEQNSKPLRMDEILSRCTPKAAELLKNRLLGAIRVCAVGEITPKTNAAGNRRAGVSRLYPDGLWCVRYSMWCDDVADIAEGDTYCNGDCKNCVESER